MNAPFPPNVTAALATLEPAMQQAFADAIAGVTSQAAVGQIEDAIARGDYQGATALLRINSTTFGQLGQVMLQAQWAGGGLVAGPAPGLVDPFSGMKVVLGFNGFHPRAMSAAQAAADRITGDLTQEALTSIPAFIRTGIEAGQGPRSVALDIVGRLNRVTGKREGGVIGLTGPQMQWVANARAELSDPATAAAFINRAARDKRFDRMILKAAKDGNPLASADVDKIVTAYSSRLLKLRGEMIARTEALNALRAGQYEGWQQAIDKGQVNATDLEVIWNATPDKFTRHSHMVLDAKKVMFGAAFVTEHGSRLRFPGDTSMGAAAEDVINCRCSFDVRRKRYG